MKAFGKTGSWLAVAAVAIGMAIGASASASDTKATELDVDQLHRVIENERAYSGLMRPSSGPAPIKVAYTSPDPIGELLINDRIRRRGERKVRGVASPEALSAMLSNTLERSADNLARHSEAGVASAVRCLALNLYHEARAEGLRGQSAVGHVVLNRVADKRYPDSVCGVVKQGGERGVCQFSWYCDGRSDEPSERNAFERAREIASGILDGSIPDPTGGATSFHATRVRPYWAGSLRRTVTIGGHAFYTGF